MSHFGTEFLFAEKFLGGVFQIWFYETTATLAICSAGGFDGVDFAFFKITINRSSIHIRECCGFLDSEKIFVILTKRTPNLVSGDKNLRHLNSPYSEISA